MDQNDQALEIRKINVAVLVAAVAAVVCLGAVLVLDGFTQGAVAALGAAIVFGSSSLPAKHPSVGIVGTASFQVHLGCPGDLG